MRMNEIRLHALKLLSARDYTAQKLREKLEARFGPVPQETIDELVRRNFLNDRRYAENYVLRRKDRGAALLREELVFRGVPAELAGEILAQIDWPSLKSALAAKIKDWNLHVPLKQRDAARLFRALRRLGYDEDAIQEETHQLIEKT